MQSSFTGRKLQILFVDDDADDRDIINEVFCRLQWQQHIHISPDADHLFQLLDSLTEDQYPELIVLDTQLPKEGGESILKLLKRQERYQPIPVVMLTSSLTENKQRIFQRLGASSSLQKPDTLNGYESIMRELIQFTHRRKHESAPQMN